MYFEELNSYMFRTVEVHYLLYKTIMKVTNKMQLYRLIYYSYSALRVSGDVFAHHQEHLTVFTVSVAIPTTLTEVPEIFPGGKGGRCVGLTNLLLSCADVLEIL